jgi:hypothetical protein
MKRFSPLLAVFAAGLAAASFATASPPPGKGPGHGKHQSTTSGTTTSGTLSCHPIVSTILKGTFTAGGGTSFTMNVTHANHHGQTLLGSQTITVDSSTKFRRNGPATLADFKSGDRLLVQARTCKAHHGEAASSNSQSAAPLLAKRVVGHPAKSSGASGENESGSTTTSTTP